MKHGCKKIIGSALIGFILSSTACHTVSTIHPEHGTVMDHMHAELNKDIQIDKRNLKQSHSLPAGVSKAFMPSLDSSLSQSSGMTERHFTITAKKTDARAFFMELMEGTSSNIVVSPAVNGTISLTLKDVTLEQALEAVRDTYGFEIHKTDYGYEVLPPSLETKIFSVNYLDVRRSGKSLTELSSGQITEKIGTVSAGNSTSNTSSLPQSSNTSANPTAQPSGSSVDTRSEANFWRDLQKTLKIMIGEQNGRSVIVNPQAGVVIVHAFSPELRQVGRYLDRLQNSLSRQVILEAKILEVQLNDQYQAGIDWNLIGDVIGAGDGGIAQSSSKTFSRTDLGDFASIFTISAPGNFGGLIKLLQTQGNVQVLSSPRISTVNNQKAVIKVGQDEFFVTGVSTQSPVVTGSVATAPTQNVDLTPFFSGVTLDVTPQISSNGTVILHIHPAVSTVKEQTKNIVLGTTPNTTTNTTTSGAASNNTYTLPLALSTIRESDNIVRAESGQIVVIGGLMQNTMVEEVAGVPVASKLPIFGPFFRRTSQISQKTELIILLRPIIADRHAFIDEMKGSERMLQTMTRGFHTGGLPEVFGNEGEESISKGKGSKDKE